MDLEYLTAYQHFIKTFEHLPFEKFQNADYAHKMGLNQSRFNIYELSLKILSYIKQDKVIKKEPKLYLVVDTGVILNKPRKHIGIIKMQLD